MVWRCVRIEDKGRTDSFCDICRRRVRHVHVMVSLQHPEPVMAGCRCAGKLEGDHVRARRRERMFASLALKLDVFLRDASWRRAGGGERFDAREWSVHVHYAQTGWIATISHARICYVETLPALADLMELRKVTFERLLELVADDRVEDFPLRQPELNLAA